MAHWAELNDDNVVLRVTVGSNEEPDEGYQWLVDNLGGRWVKTSFNTLGGVHLTGGTPFRKNYAGIGYTYDEEKDAFIPPKPSNHMVLNEETCLWEYPFPAPTDGKDYIWDDTFGEWVEV